MKQTIILAAVLSVFSITTTFAQTEPAKPAKKQKTEKAERGQRGGNSMADLNLTADQQNKMKVLNEEMRTKSEAIRNDASLTQEQKREKSMELRKATGEKRKAILTAEQQKKWDEKMKERMKDRNKGRQ